MPVFCNPAPGHGLQDGGGARGSCNGNTPAKFFRRVTGQDDAAGQAKGYENLINLSFLKQRGKALGF